MNHGLRSTEGQAVPLESVRLSGEILGDRARLVLRQVYRHREARPIEAIYTFPLPPEAVLAGFRIEVDGRRIDGALRPREEAAKLYHEAVLDGDGATLLERERGDVHTLSVGNLKPGSTLEAELELLLALQPEAHALRLAIPTLVAPRYIPGAPDGGRTGDGASPPTDRVPDADRITPPVGDSPYRLELDLELAGPEGLELSSPSHAVELVETDGRRAIRFAGPGEPLDRDLVLVLRGEALEPAATVRRHRPSEGPSTLAVTVAPPAGDDAAEPLTIALVVDVSGSMAGASIEQARRAARLCLRQLRGGDRFHLLAFDHELFEFRPEPVAFDERALAEADAWIDALEARGSTELGPALLHAARAVPKGALLVLTDGQVGQEEEILGQLAALGTLPRISSIGIGTVVTTTLLGELARSTGGWVEELHPGEAIEPKVVAQFARLSLPAWTGVRLEDGTPLEAVAPKGPWTLVEGEPFTFFAHADGKLPKTLRLTGERHGERRSWSLPVRAGRAAARPELERFHAALRLRDLEATQVQLIRSGIRSGTARTRAKEIEKQILELSLASGVICRHTAWVAIEKRTAAEKTDGLPELRVVPVSPAAGWEMLEDSPDISPAAGAYVSASMAPVRDLYHGPRFAPPIYRSDPDPSPAATAPPVPRRAQRPPKEVESFVPRKRPRRDPSGDPISANALFAKQDFDGLWTPEGGDHSTAARLRETRRVLHLLDPGDIALNHWCLKLLEKAVRALLDLLRGFEEDDPLDEELLHCSATLLRRAGGSKALLKEIDARLRGLPERRAGDPQAAS